jgi:hypothetical protein
MTFAAVALALSFTLPGAGSGGKPYDGTNGLNPAALSIGWTGGWYEPHPRASRNWFRWIETADPELRAERREVTKYLVRCAFGRDVEVRYGGEVWTGEFGFGGQVAVRVEGLRVPSKQARRPVRLAFASPERQWVSACLLAFVNTGHRHEYVSLRASGGDRRALEPGAADRWTYGYPEGVFLADLLPTDPEAKPHPDADLERSYTLSMNLPEGYEAGRAAWRPYNASIGRTLTWLDETRVRNKTRPGDHRVARRLGTFGSGRAQLALEPARAAGSPVKCGAPTSRGALPDACAYGGETLRPVFVYLPHVVKLVASIPGRGAQGGPITVVSTGAELTDAEARACDAATCTHPFPPASEQASAPPILEPERLVLGADQAVRVTLSGAPEDVDRKQRFTAIVRYAAANDAVRTSVRVSGTATPLEVAWPKATDEWMYIYPVRVTGAGALELELAGGGPALELDVAGFVARPPRCHGDPETAYAGVCR